jgi:hypothetical protein
MMKGVPTAVVALVIGLVAALIAYRQYRVAHAKLSLDLFDKRYAIFLAIWEILSETARRGVAKGPTNLATPFNNYIPQAAFLFGSEIEEYLNTAVKNWADMWAIQKNTEDNRNVVQQSDIARRSELEKWFFQEASEGAKRRFGKYLNFEQWR